MKKTDTYKPKFDIFHDRHMVTWSENGLVRIADNHLAQYLLWKSAGKQPKHEPPPAFWESCGPAIVRALTYCRASALALDRVADRRVSYVWFAAKDGSGPQRDWYDLCSVVAEGGRAGSDTHVGVTLPTGEVASFLFSAGGMVDWLRPSAPPAPDELCLDPGDRIVPSEIQDLIVTKADR